MEELVKTVEVGNFKEATALAAQAAILVQVPMPIVQPATLPMDVVQAARGLGLLVPAGALHRTVGLENSGMEVPVLPVQVPVLPVQEVLQAVTAV